MKRLFALFILAVLCVPVLMAIPSESSLKWYLQNTSYFPIVASASYGGVQEMEVRRSTGYVFENKDTILVVRMLNNATGVQSMLSPVSSYRDKIKYIVIFSEKNNIQIAPYVFQSYKNLQAVYAYVDTISYYGMAAFSGCENLTAIEGRNGVFPPCESMSGAAFAGCGFTSIDLSNSDSITFSSSVFANCTSLQRFVFPPKVGAKSEMTTGVISVRYDGVEGMFKNCRALQTVVPPDYMKVARTKEMFYNCESLTELNIPNGVALLGNDILHGCTNLKKITIPSSITGYTENLFNDCDALDTVVFAAPVLRPHTFDSCPNLHVLTLEYWVDSIADYAFSGLRNVSSITLPNTIHAISGGAFLGSTGINDISIEGLGTGFMMWDGVLFKGHLHELVYAPEAHTPSRFALDNKTKHIGPYAFYNNSRLDTVMLHYHLETIADSAFAGCTNIRKLYIPNMQTTVGEHAFDGVQEVVWSNMNYPNGWCNYDFVWSIDSIGVFSFQGKTGEILHQTWDNYHDSIKFVIWPEGVAIPEACMENYYSIQCAVLPIKGEELQYPAFRNTQFILFNDNFFMFPLLQPVDIEMESDLEITPMYDSLLVRWKAPGPEPENLYGYVLRRGAVGEEGGYPITKTAFNSEAFHNRLLDSIRTGCYLELYMEGWEWGNYPCNDGAVLPSEYTQKVYEMKVPMHDRGLYSYRLSAYCGGMENEVAAYRLDSISTANTMPQNLQMTKDESQLSDGILSLTFDWEWLKWNVNTAEWQLVENNTVIHSAFIAPNNDVEPAQGTHTEQVTAEQIGYGEHTLSWRVRAVQDSNHNSVLSSWAKGDDIQFTFTNPEGIEDIHIDGNLPTKVLHEDRIYILRGEKIYTLQGQEVR